MAIKTLKTTKTPTSRKTTTRVPKPVAKRQRPVHKRILLHPFSVMVLLCVGVIITGSTFHSTAASYDVHASVSAQPVTSPAIITQPTANEHFIIRNITVAGTCPAHSYVKLLRASVFMGVAQCSNGTFQIQTDLLPGANSMQAKVYNVTNDEGPVSQPVTLYYDEVKLQPQTPATTPTNVWIENVGASPYHTGVSTSTSDRPTITGFAPPFSDITVTFHSDPVVCKTQADDKGWWTCTLQQSLPEGTHHVEVWAYSPSGEKIPCPVFSIVVKLGLPNLLKSHGSKPPLLIITDYYFQTHYIGQPFRWNMTFSSGAAPYKLNIDWGDGNQSTVTRTDGSAFPLTHAFVPSKTYTVFMTVTDANGETAMVQLSAVVKDEPIGPASITNSGPIASVLASIKQYLWVVWPVYIAVVLMVMSYWLGEQEMYQRLVKRHVTRHGKER